MGTFYGSLISFSLYVSRHIRCGNAASHDRVGGVQREVQLLAQQLEPAGRDAGLSQRGELCSGAAGADPRA